MEMQQIYKWKRKTKLKEANGPHPHSIKTTKVRLVD